MWFWFIGPQQPACFWVRSTGQSPCGYRPDFATLKPERFRATLIFPILPADMKTTPPRKKGLSKSRIMKGAQCTRRLWWTVFEPDAPELKPSPALEARFATGHRVGDEAQRALPGGVLIELEDGLDVAASATTKAIEEGAKRIYEASFIHKGIFVAVDILEQAEAGWRIIEVKSTGSVKPNHILDSAIQRWVVEGQGLAVWRTEVMHLNTDREVENDGPLFVRTDTTRKTQALLEEIPFTIQTLQATLKGPLPLVEPGKHCTQPYPCEFFLRCNPEPEPHGLHELYRVKKAILNQLHLQGIRTIADIPVEVVLPAVASRQRRAIKEGRVVIEAEVAEKLNDIQFPAAFIDFEAINPALPPWGSTRPFATIPVQVSIHSVDENGRVKHLAWLAPEGEDPRPALARAVLAGIEGAKTLVAYHASFEKRVITELAEHLEKADKFKLLAANNRFFDLLPLVRNHVYHPSFHGRFSLKAVIRALLPDLHYGDLEVQSGDVASAQLQQLIVDGTAPTGVTREECRANLLAYCERDTWVMVQLYEYLKQALEMNR